jgi:hypothetical protein
MGKAVSGAGLRANPRDDTPPTHFAELDEQDEQAALKLTQMVNAMGQWNCKMCFKRNERWQHACHICSTPMKSCGVGRGDAFDTRAIDGIDQMVGDFTDYWQQDARGFVQGVVKKTTKRPHSPRAGENTMSSTGMSSTGSFPSLRGTSPALASSGALMSGSPIKLKRDMNQGPSEFTSKCFECHTHGFEAQKVNRDNCTHTCRNVLAHKEEDWFLAVQRAQVEHPIHKKSGRCNCKKCLAPSARKKVMDTMRADPFARSIMAQKRAVKNQRIADETTARERNAETTKERVQRNAYRLSNEKQLNIKVNRLGSFHLYGPGSTSSMGIGGK